MSVFAIAPAKAYSRRLPGKNAKILAGHPLFGHAIRVAKEAAGIDEVLLSSDSDEILEAGMAYGARPLKRPAELCADNATNFQVLCHILKTLREEGAKPDLLVLLQVTAPFRSSEALAKMVAKMQASPDADSLMTVAPIERVLGHIEDGLWVPHGGLVSGAAQRMKAGDKTYAISGHAFVIRPERTLDKNTLLGEKTLAEPLPEDWFDIDIDTPRDWAIAEAFVPFWKEEK